MRRGYVRASAKVLTLTLFIILGASAYYFGGVRSTNFFSLIILIFTSGWLLGTNATIVTTTASVLLGLGLVYLENNNLLPESLTPNTSTILLGGLISNFILVAIFLHLATQNLKVALNSARTNASELNRRAIQLESVIDMGRVAASIHSIDDLLPYAVNLISERFGFYHVSIYLFDKASAQSRW